MRALLALTAAALLCVGLGACAGSSGRGTSTTAAAAKLPPGAPPTWGPGKRDRDNDSDNNDDDQLAMDFGHPAGAADRRAITALVKRYYAAAAAGDGARACALLAPFVAEAVPEEESPPGMHNPTCAQVMSHLFATKHARLVGESRTLKVLTVGIEGDRSLTTLEVPSLVEVRQVTVRRIGDSWRILTLLDGILE